MADNSPPDRLSNNPRSPHFDVEALQRGVGIRFKDRERGTSRNIAFPKAGSGSRPARPSTATACR